MTKIFRFAPSPTGKLHVGNVRTAFINWLAARKQGGKFFLRIDDTDRSRSTTAYEEGIKSDLKWLGMDWDDTFNQHKRMKVYEAAKQQLIANGRLYPCYETKEELEFQKKVLLSRNLPPIYDRAALNLSDDEKVRLESEGRQPHWRFKLLPGDISWHDEVRGAVHFKAENISDPILIRGDGTMTYSLASVVDDIEYNVSNIVRGEDHISNSAVHVQLFEALGAKAPQFAHLSLIKSLDGEISKRSGGFDIAALREQGLEAQTIVNFLAKIGSAEVPNAEDEMTDLVASFAFNKFSKSPTKYDPSQLFKLNEKRVHSMSYNKAKTQLSLLDLAEIDEEFWNAVHRNISTLAEIKEWWHICREDIRPVIEDQSYINTALELLPAGIINENSWKEWTNALKQATNRKGKELFMPLRLALTGQSFGPEMNLLLPLIGKEKIEQRLQ